MMPRLKPCHMQAFDLLDCPCCSPNKPASSTEWPYFIILRGNVRCDTVLLPVNNTEIKHVVLLSEATH